MKFSLVIGLISELQSEAFMKKLGAVGENVG